MLFATIYESRSTTDSGLCLLLNNFLKKEKMTKLFRALAMGFEWIALVLEFPSAVFMNISILFHTLAEKNNELNEEEK